MRDPGVPTDLVQFVQVAVNEIIWLPWDPGLLVLIDQIRTHFQCRVSVLKSLLKRQGQASYQRKSVIYLQETRILKSYNRSRLIVYCLAIYLTLITESIKIILTPYHGPRPVDNLCILSVEPDKKLKELIVVLVAGSKENSENNV